MAVGVVEGQALRIMRVVPNINSPQEELGLRERQMGFHEPRRVLLLCRDRVRSCSAHSWAARYIGSRYRPRRKPLSMSKRWLVVSHLFAEHRARVYTRSTSGDRMAPGGNQGGTECGQAGSSSCWARAVVSGKLSTSANPFVRCPITSGRAERSMACCPARCQYGMACTGRPASV